MKLTRKSVETVILVIFAVTLVVMCKYNVLESENKNNVPVSDTNIFQYEEGMYHQKENRNLYFFELGTEQVSYQVNYSFNSCFSGTADLLITKIRNLEYGEVYELKIAADELLGENNSNARERFQLGYFYVTPTQIYRMNDKEVATMGTEDELISAGTVVCAMWENDDKPDENGWHEYITLKENRCEFHSYNNQTETGFYERFTWEEGKGLVEYRSGYGAERDSICLQRSEATEEENLAEQYYGKWKVVEYIPLERTTVELSYWVKEHYLGRTVEITENSYTKSIYYWPYELEAYTEFYDYCEVVDLAENDTWITRNDESLRWLDGEFFENGVIRMLRFYQDERDYATGYCAVTSDNEHLVDGWLGGEYLLERFDKQDTSVTVEDIYGEWEITRLDSYDSSYEGNVSDSEWLEISKIDDVELDLSDFYAPEWFEKDVDITKEKLDITSEITGHITRSETQVVNKESFEQEQGIHDELSLTNEEIIIFKIHYGETDEVLTVVPFNQNKMALHIGQGWFIMERDEAYDWKWVVETEKYEDIVFIDNDLMAVKNETGKYAIATMQGETLTPFMYESISAYKNDLAVVRIDGKCQYIDRNFQMVIEGEFEAAREFCYGLAAVKIDGKWGFIDETGAVVISCQFDEAHSFSDYRAAVKIGDGWNFIDTSGKLVSEENYEEVKDFSEYMAAVKKNGKWGFVDISNTVYVDFLYDGVGNFSENVAAVKVIENGVPMCAYINYFGEIKIDYQPCYGVEGRMNYIGDFHEGVAFMSKDLYCAIDRNGEVLCGNNTEFFISACVYYPELGVIPGYVYADEAMTIRKYGLMDDEGEARLEPVFDYVGALNGNYLIVEENVDGEWRKGMIELLTW